MMVRVALLALIACGLAGFGTIFWMVMPHGEEAVAAAAPVRQVEKIKVLVAAKSLVSGGLLKPEEITMHEVDADKLPGGYLADDAQLRHSLVGGMVRRAMAAGEVMSGADVVRPADHGFLSAVLRPGYRAVTVAVDALSGAAGLVWPGDRVDLILTQQLDDQGLAPGRKIAAETVLRNVRVIAIDQQATPGAGATAADATPARTITLEVSSADGEEVQVATKLGKLSLAVRSAESGPSDDRGGTTWAGDVSSALNSRAAAKPQPTTMHVFTGGGEGKEFKF